MPYRASKNCSELLDMTDTCPTKMLTFSKMTQTGPKKLPKIAKKCSKLFKVAQICSKLFKVAQNAKCLTMGQQASKRSDVLAQSRIYRCESCHYLALLLPVSIVAWA